MWQMGGLGPMLGQHGTLRPLCYRQDPYAIARYRDEARAASMAYSTGSLAGRALMWRATIPLPTWPASMDHERTKRRVSRSMTDPNIKRWYAEVRARPEVQRAWRSANLRRRRWTKRRAATCSVKPQTTDTNRGNAIMIEFFFDCSSPWTYLGFHNIQPLAKELAPKSSGSRFWSGRFQHREPQPV